MTDALISPAVGGVMAGVSVIAIGYSIKKLNDELNTATSFSAEKKIPMMGVMGAFVFAAQMVNFPIPGTGSSGHIIGGILLASLLGPYAALLTVVSVLIVQCLLFGDGGILALGCNIFNMGVCSCLIAYPLVYKTIVKNKLNKKFISAAAVVSAVLGLQLGALCVVAEVKSAGVVTLSFGAFTALMLPIHLAIGFAEGVITAAVLSFVYGARPEILECYGEADLTDETASLGAGNSANKKTDVSYKKPAIAFLIAAVLVCGVSFFASRMPDGLEWTLLKLGIK